MTLRLAFSLAVLCVLLACGAWPTPTPTPEPTATWTPIPPFPTSTATWTPTPDVVSLPDSRTFALFVVSEYGEITRYSEHLGVEHGTRIYLKFEDAAGLHLAVFGDAGGKWGLLEVRDLPPVPMPTVTATPWDGAEGARFSGGGAPCNAGRGRSRWPRPRRR
jgi:hypothetical protein